MTESGNIKADRFLTQCPVHTFSTQFHAESMGKLTSDVTGLMVPDTIHWLHNGFDGLVMDTDRWILTGLEELLMDING